MHALIPSKYVLNMHPSGPPSRRKEACSRNRTPRCRPRGRRRPRPRPHTASHVQVHTSPDSSLAGPEDPPAQKYARSTPPVGPNADVRCAHALAAAEHSAAATAHHDTAGREYERASHHLSQGNFAAMTAARKRAETSGNKARAHETHAEYHRGRQAQLVNHAPLRDVAAAHEIESANQSMERAKESARNA